MKKWPLFVLALLVATAGFAASETNSSDYTMKAKDQKGTAPYCAPVYSAYRYNSYYWPRGGVYFGSPGISVGFNFGGGHAHFHR